MEIDLPDENATRALGVAVAAALRIGDAVCLTGPLGAGKSSLARALYAHTKLDGEVPAALFAAVAQVLAYVYQLRAALAGQAPQPGELPELNVPPELDPHQQPVPDMEDFAQ